MELHEVLGVAAVIGAMAVATFVVVPSVAVFVGAMSDVQAASPRAVTSGVLALGSGELFVSIAEASFNHRNRRGSSRHTRLWAGWVGRARKRWRGD